MKGGTEKKQDFTVNDLKETAQESLVEMAE